MKLKESDMMASIDIIPAPVQKGYEIGTDASLRNARSLSVPWLLFVSESGLGKRVPLSLFCLSPRNRVGLVGHTFSSEDKLAAAFVVGFSLGEDGDIDEQVVLVSQSGTVNKIKVRDVSIQLRYAWGFILMRLEYGGKIQSTSLILATVKEPEDNEASSNL